MKRKAIEVRDLHFSYPESPPAISGLSFFVSEGESLAVIGPNGAGKTTLLLHLNGLLRGQGEVVIFDEKIEKARLRNIRSRVGLVFQDPDDQLFMPSIADDVAFGPINLGWDEEKVKEKTEVILGFFRLAENASKPASRLSLGERKKASLATVLVMEPDILVFDEPTAGLDSGSRRRLIRIINDLRQTKVIATHDLDLAWETCDRVLFIDRGRWIAEGQTKDILRNSALLEAHSLELPLSAR